MQLNQAKYLNDQAQIFQNRTKSTHLRRQILQNQQSRNYQTEYDRLRHHVEGSASGTITKQHVTDRVARLKKLGAKAVDGIN